MTTRPTHPAPRAPRTAAFDLVRQLREVWRMVRPWQGRMLNVTNEPAGEAFRVSGDDVAATANALLVYALALYRADRAQVSRALHALTQSSAEAYAVVFAVAPDLENAFRRQAAESAPDATGVLRPLSLFLHPSLEA